MKMLIEIVFSLLLYGGIFYLALKLLNKLFPAQKPPPAEKERPKARSPFLRQRHVRAGVPDRMRSTKANALVRKHRDGKPLRDVPPPVVKQIAITGSLS